MSDGDDRDAGKTTAFFLGFLLGVLVCLGAGGTFFVVQSRRTTMMMEQAHREALLAREQVEVERQRAVQALEAARKNLDQLRD